METDDIGDIEIMMETSCSLYEGDSNRIIQYINKLDISCDTKNLLLCLVQNDNHNDYIEIYNICMENGIELPPLI